MCVYCLLSQSLCLWCASFKILGGFMKWALRNKTAEKKASNGDFQVVGFLLYAHYPIYFFLSFEHYYQVLCCVKIQEKV